MYLRDLFSWRRIGEVIDNGDFQYLYTGTGEPGSTEIKNWVIGRIYVEKYEYDPIAILRSPNHITDFLDYHLIKYNERYTQSDNLAFIETFELVWRSKIRQHDLEESSYVDIAVSKWMEAHEPDMPQIRHTNIPFRRLCEIFDVGKDMTDDEMTLWFRQNFHATVIDGVDLTNGVDKQAYINNFMERHLAKYLERYTADEIEFALVVSHSQNRVGSCPMLHKWCVSKLTDDYITPLSTTSTAYNTTSTLFRPIAQHKIEELYKLLVSINCIDRQTTPEALCKFLQTEDYDKKVVWIGSKQLFRELLSGLHKEGVKFAAIEQYVPKCCVDKKGDVLKLAKNKIVGSTESDKIADFLATL